QVHGPCLCALDTIRDTMDAQAHEEGRDRDTPKQRDCYRGRRGEVLQRLCPWVWTFATATQSCGQAPMPLPLCGQRGASLTAPLPNIHTLHRGGLTVAQIGRKSTFAAGAVSFAVQHELWDGNVDDHSDQGVAILVNGQVEDK